MPRFGSFCLLTPRKFMITKPELQDDQGVGTRVKAPHDPGARYSIGRARIRSCVESRFASPRAEQPQSSRPSRATAGDRTLLSCEPKRDVKRKFPTATEITRFRSHLAEEMQEGPTHRKHFRPPFQVDVRPLVLVPLHMADGTQVYRHRTMYLCKLRLIELRQSSPSAMFGSPLHAAVRLHLARRRRCTFLPRRR